MAIQDRIAHATAVAKWKADQQLRLLKSQNRIGEIEGQIRSEKSTLADKTLALYAQEQLVEEELKQICATIAVFHGQVKEQQHLQEAIRGERPPEQQSYSAAYPPAQPVEVQPESLSGFICPQCNRRLVGRFCPEHGVEGVYPQKTSEEGKTDSASPQLVCPKCGKTLSVRFCPEHGVEGVPQ
jgi:hypothetical protein